jgi:predicted TIM-barrel fold metal-dependent hydrolase
VTAHSDEIGLDSQSFSVFHYAPQNFLSTMILGGVFDRHPNLYVGIIEYGGSWIGPMAENVQQWHNHFGRKAAQKLERPIYDYIRDHVRTSLMYFEEPDKYINRFGLEEVYCYASDYPHLEGGTNPVERITERLSGFGEETWQRVFVKNAELMFPA